MRNLMGTGRAAVGVGLVLWGIAVFVRLHAAENVAPAADALTQASTPALIDYERQVQPLFRSYCLECHSQDKRKGGLSLGAYADVLDGGRSGAVIRPGSATTSLITHRLTGTVGDQMPLDELPLSGEELAIIRLWIDQGARPAPTAPPAPPPWEAPMALDSPAVPDAIWAGWSQPIDRLVASYLSRKGARPPALANDTAFARRVYLDVWGLPPSPEALQAFVADRAPDKRERLVTQLLADNDRYAEHWISFWNDLLRNEDGVTYFSEDAGRKSITEWLLSSLRSNLRYDEFVRKLLNPATPGDPDGFLVGVNWRGETSAAVKPWMQASQNTAQVFLGVNMKCNACHDSFVSRWTLKDAYALAAYFSPEPRLQLFRCDVARDEYAEPAFLFPELNRVPPSGSLADRRAAAAAIFTDPRNGRMPRTVVNRLWDRLLGRGIVAQSDDMDGVPWSPAVLDWVASDFVEHEYDLKHLLATILTSRAYQMAAVARADEAPARNYTFNGPEVRRLTAEQFADAIGAITGEWGVASGRRPGSNAQQPASKPAAPAQAAGGGRGSGPRMDSDPLTSGYYAREWRASSNHLSRALGRPIRDQVHSVRAVQATTPQALELVNGEILTRRLLRGARRLVGELPPEPPSLFNAFVGGRNATARGFDLDISGVSKLWMIVADTGSNAPERVLPVWANVMLEGPDGPVPLSTLGPADSSGLRPGGDPSQAVTRLGVKNPSRLVYDLSGRGFTRIRGLMDVENARSEIGSTLNPQLRFFLFDREPNMDRLIPTEPALPFPAPPVFASVREVVDHIFWSALHRAPTAAERRDAEAAAADPRRPGRPSVEGVADLLWAVLMKPEFQLIY